MGSMPCRWSVLWHQATQQHQTKSSLFSEHCALCEELSELFFYIDGILAFPLEFWTESTIHHI